MDQIKTQLSLYPPYFGPYPQNPNGFRSYKPSFPNTHSSSPPRVPILPSNQKAKPIYWKFLSPAIFGTVGALFLSLFSNDGHLVKRFDGTLFKLAILGYTIGATVAVSFAITEVITDPTAFNDRIFSPVLGGLVTIILFFTAQYFLLYRFFPSTFKGDVGDNVWIQLLSFLYLSVTTVATADLGDILPGDITARLLIATEIGFNLFTLATGIQLLLAQSQP